MLHLQAAHLKRQGTAPSFASLIVKKAPDLDDGERATRTWLLK